MRAVQLHGHESAEDTRWVRQRVPMVIKAFSAGDPRLARAVDYGADVVLLDGPRPGSGQGWDRSLVDEVPAGLRVMVAGGVTPGNVAEVIARTHCWGVDVSTGVEKAPGVKDPVKLRELIAAAKAADPDGPDGGPYDWEEDG
jgi:phosphoribosylanthranilate isomerase